jgi:pimeloyl-ACP methyl ester carboxylesterase
MPHTSNSSSTFYSLNKVNKDNPIVFIHGVGLSNIMWKPQVNFFKEYNTLSYDLLGHGKTPLKKTKVTFNDFSRQLLNIINELKFEKIHLVGFSLGALIARHFASKHNNRLSSLIIHGSIYKRTEEQKRIVINRLHVAKHNRSVSKKSSITRWLTEDFISKNPETYDEIYSILESNNNKNFLKCYELFTHYIDDDDEIEKINVNTLITTGEHDVRSTPEMAINLNKVIKNSKFVNIKKGKHLCSIECADDVNITFKKFIDENNVQT